VPILEITTTFTMEGKSVTGGALGAGGGGAPGTVPSVINMTGTCAFAWSQGQFDNVNHKLDGTATTGVIAPPPAGQIDNKRLVTGKLENYGTISSTSYVVLDGSWIQNFGRINLLDGWRFDGADSNNVVPSTTNVAEIDNVGFIDDTTQGRIGFENNVTTRRALLFNDAGGNPSIIRVSAGNGMDILWDVQSYGDFELLSGNTNFGAGITAGAGSSTRLNDGNISVPDTINALGTPTAFYLTGGILDGVGRIDGAVLNGFTFQMGQLIPTLGGIVHPGIGPGTGVMVIGTYAQSAFGMLAISIDAANQLNSLLFVKTSAFIDGELFVLPIAGAASLTSGSFPFLLAFGGITGNFSHYDPPVWDVGPTRYTLILSESNSVDTLTVQQYG